MDNFHINEIPLGLKNDAFYTDYIPKILGQTLFRGVSSGLFGLCAKIASFPEVQENGVLSYVVLSNDPETFGERWLTLRNILDKVAQMGQSATQWVLTWFTWDTVVNRFFAVFGVAGVPLSAS